MTAGRARTAVTGIFFVNGAAFSGWYARLPAIQDKLDLSPGQLGLALFAAPLGLLCAQPAVGAVVARRGSRSVVRLAPLFSAAIVLPALATNLGTLALAVLVVGAANGSLDIAMNAQGVAVERASGTRMFNSLHAAFSFGALAGAGLAAAAAAAGVAPLPHLAVSAALCAGGALVFIRRLLPDEGHPGARRLARPTWRLAALGVVAFAALLAEGSVFDWSGVFLDHSAGAAAGVAPLGLAAFSLCMGLGRLSADGIAERVGSAATARGGAVIAAAGIGVAIAVATPAAAVAGFALMGAGLSAVFPLALRAAGLDEDVPGPALAAVSTVGYAGFLTGPPVIGALADAGSLRSALLLVPSLCLVAAALSGHVRDPRPRAGSG
ncbi:MAG TPA: MFS transporter [Thermoleophilaceae bacterium]|nr:MFS transporter [Thermoleophilaceae bacterium]